MRILLVDDHAPTRTEISSLIESQDDLTVVGEANDGYEGVHLSSELKPDVIIMDVAMPELNGIDATIAIRASEPNARIIALSNHVGRYLVQTMMDAGAIGFIRKDHAYEELIPAIRTVAQGESCIGSGIVL